MSDARRGSASLVLLLIGPACFDPTFTDATQCGPEGACPTGRQCVAGRCVRGGGETSDAADVDAADVDGATGYRLMLTKAGGGAGSVDGGAVLSCAADCPSTQTVVGAGMTVMLEATPAPGSYFQGWRGDCQGPHRFCSLQMVGERSVEAVFATIEHNLVFATAVKVRGDFGGVEPGDAMCAAAAAEAGLTGRFIAWLAPSGTASITSRLQLPESSTPARGFVRLDGQPIADTVDDLISVNRVWYPILYDQNGALHEGPVWTGTDLRGLHSTFDCIGWGSMDQAQIGHVGRASAGPRFAWTGFETCDELASLYCVGVEKDAAVAAPPRAAGKLIYPSAARLFPDVTAGYAAAQALCDGEKPAGVASVSALLATRGQRASRFLQAGSVYVRVDGVRVGTGEALIAGQLESGIWQEASGAYSVALGVWTGSTGVAALESTTEPSCNDWTGGAGMGVVGVQEAHATRWWIADVASCSRSDGYPVYCVEQ